MNLGELLAGAGSAGEGWRRAEMSEYDLAQRRLQTQQQLRQDRLAQLRAAQGVSQADYSLPPSAGLTLGSQLPVLPAVPEPAPAPTLAPAPAPAPVATQPAATTPAVPPTPSIAGLSLPPVTGLTREEADRLRLSVPFTVAADVFQQPAALALNAASAGVSGAANLGGRVINAVTGEPTVRTDYQTPFFPAFPFTEQYYYAPLRAARARAVEEQLKRVPSTPEGQMPEFPVLLDAMQFVASNNDPNAVSKKGEIGLMQVTSETAMNPGFGLPTIFDLAEQANLPFNGRTEAEAKRLLRNGNLNRAFAGSYLNFLLSRYNNNFEIALAAYRTDPRRIDNWLAAGADYKKLPKQAQDYIPKVLTALNGGTAPAAPAAGIATPAAPAVPAAAPAAGIAIPPGVQGAAAPAAAAPAAAAPAAAAPAAQAYDTKVTPYDPLIQQSAAQYGIDPVIFKRLLGTESSFNPTAVSPRGEKFGLGIAQINAVHGLTREQRLDPNTSIPFAAQLFSQYLQQAGGDYEQAILRYKGASSEQGKASMMPSVTTILSGITPAAATAAAPAVTDEGRLRVDVSGVSNKYIGNPEQISFDLNAARTNATEALAYFKNQRDQLESLRRFQLRLGTQAGITAAQNTDAQIAVLDAKALELRQGFRTQEVYLQGMQAISEMQLANDPRRAAAVASLVAGVPVNFQYREDGRMDILVNGIATAKNMSEGQAIEQFRLLFDPAHRKTVTEEKLKRAAAIFQSQTKMAENISAERAQMFREIAVEALKGNNARAVELAKNRGVKFTTIPGEPRFVLMQQGDSVYRVGIEGTIEEVDGEKIERVEAKPVNVRR